VQGSCRRVDHILHIALNPSDKLTRFPRVQVPLSGVPRTLQPVRLRVSFVQGSCHGHVSYMAMCAILSPRSEEKSHPTPTLGRILWLRRVLRLENPLGHGNFLSGLKLSGERDGGLGLARFSAVCPLGGHMSYVRKWPFMARRYGRCCMYGPA
jgi:hypothetical protein